MAKLKVDGPRPLAKKLGEEYYKTDLEGNVGRWVRGVNAPNFHGTMRLLEVSGWLTSAGLQAYGRAVQRATEEDAEAALRRVEPGAQRPDERVGRRRG
jgi:hypothetical protein